jgi:hypothetical protein
MGNLKRKRVHYVMSSNGESLCGKFRNGTIDAEQERPWDPEDPMTCPACKKLYNIMIRIRPDKPAEYPITP